MAARSIDWVGIKAEYINTNISQRKLAEKYNVSITAIKKRATKEKWLEQKKQARHKIDAKVTQNIEDKMIEIKTDRISRMLDLSDQLAEKIQQAIDELDIHLVTNKKKKKTVEYKDNTAIGKPTKEIIEEDEEIVEVKSTIDRLGLQQVANALKSIKDINSTFMAEDDNNYDDDGLLTALKASVEDMEDDSDMLPKEDD